MRSIIGLGLAAAASVVGFAFVAWIAVAQVASLASRVAAPLLESARARAAAPDEAEGPWGPR